MRQDPNGRFVLYEDHLKALGEAEARADELPKVMAPAAGLGMGEVDQLAAEYAEWSSEMPFADRHPSNQDFWRRVARVLLTARKEGFVRLRSEVETSEAELGTWRENARHETARAVTAERRAEAAEGKLAEVEAERNKALTDRQESDRQAWCSWKERTEAEGKLKELGQRLRMAFVRELDQLQDEDEADEGIVYTLMPITILAAFDAAAALLDQPPEAPEKCKTCGGVGSYVHDFIFAKVCPDCQPPEEG